MKKEAYGSVLALILIVLTAGCSTPMGSTSGSPRNQSPHEKFEAIKLGDSARSVSHIWGEPSENVEKFPDSEYRVLEYSDDKNIPIAQFAIGPKSGLVVGKSRWLTPQDREYDLNFALKSQFSDVPFKTYIPCETRSPKDEVLVNEKSGLFLFRREEHLFLISWADPTLTALRINQFHKKCPQLQTEKP